MDREIKFRVWDGNHNKFIYPEVIELNCGIEYQQYTGLKDNNGQEIYEGDIVEIDIYEYAGVKEKQQLVIGNNKDNTNFWHDVSYLQKIQCKHIEVIGNVFEDKELLDG